MDTIDKAPRPAPPCTLEIESYGSPIKNRPQRWIVCFVPGLQPQWWHRLVRSPHKHVFAMRRIADDTWLLFEPWWSRLMLTTINDAEAGKFLRWALRGDMLDVQEAVPGTASQTRLWFNCAVQVSFLLGRGYWTWTPNGLFRRLRDEAGTRPADLQKALDDIKASSRMERPASLPAQATM